MFDYSTFTPDQIEERISALKSEISTADEARLSEINGELEAIEARRNELIEIEARKVEERKKVAEDLTLPIIEEMPQEDRKMVDIKEFRNSKDYVNAYAEYIKSGDDTEVRALLTENVGSGTIAVPDVVYDEVKTAWDKSELLSLVSKLEVKGNLKVNFEISGTDAVIHTEGSGAVAEETLTEGIVTLVPAFVKKWISISDEVMGMRGESFLTYIYAELTAKIVKKLEDTLIAAIVALPQAATATSPAAAQVSAAPAMATVAQAIGNLSDEAANPVVVMNKLTWAAFKAVQYANGYGVDPFEGLKVVFNNTLPAYDAAEAGAVYMIVGDFGQGALVNFPDGEGVKFVFDDKTLATQDLIRVIGKEYAAIGVVANGAFVNVVKANG